MNRTLLTVAVGFVVVGLCWLSTLGLEAVRGQAPGGNVNPVGDRQITTSGQATIVAKPDAARLWVSIESVAETLEAARDENTKKTAAVRNAVLELKQIQSKTVTRGIDVSLIYDRRDRDETVPQKVIGYRVKHSFSLLVENDDP